MHFGSLVWTPNPTSNQQKVLDPAFFGYRVQRSLYTILGKTSYTLIRLMKHTLGDSVQKSMKNELYTYLACE